MNGELTATIQTYAEGLLSFLGIKNGGQNPHELSKTILPVLELREWMFSQRWIVEASGAGSAANGEVGFRPFAIAPQLQVPNGEIWYLHEFMVHATLAAATTTLYARCAIQAPNTGQSFPIGDAVQVTGAATAREWAASMHRTQPLFLPAGWRLGLYVSIAEIAAGSISFLGAVRYTRLNT